MQARLLVVLRRFYFSCSRSPNARKLEEQDKYYAAIYKRKPTLPLNVIYDD